MRLILEQIRTGGDRNFAYLVGDREAGVAAVVDPSFDPAAVVGRATAQGLTVRSVVNTHGHGDHTNGNDEARRLTGAPLVAFAGDADHRLGDGDVLEVGALRLRALYTPGHADDHLVLFEPDERFALTGDLLFVGKVGGTSGREAARTEWDSLHRLLDAAGDDVTVWPGHDYGARPSSTVGLERRTNPFLVCEDVDAFLRLRGEWPEYKKRMGLK
jgi:glyoxylase-like metal-dependent hydrolase (beta-lactamase superfamily II)